MGVGHKRTWEGPGVPHFNLLYMAGLQQCVELTCAELKSSDQTSHLPGCAETLGATVADALAVSPSLEPPVLWLLAMHFCPPCQPPKPLLRFAGPKLPQQLQQRCHPSTTVPVPPMYVAWAAMAFALVKQPVVSGNPHRHRCHPASSGHCLARTEICY